MKAFAIRERRTDGSDHYFNIFVCDDCVNEIGDSYPNASEIFEIASDPCYDDMCRLCGSTFLREVEEHGERRDLEEGD